MRCVDNGNTIVCLEEKMKLFKRQKAMSTAVAILALFMFGFMLETDTIACDIAVVSAKASSTGRPLIWKSRDNSLSWEQEVASYARSGNTDNVAAGGSVRVIDRTRGTAAQSGGVNEAGFAITNTTVYQESPIHEYLASANLNLMSNALKRCTTVAEFDAYIAGWHLEGSNQTRILSGNFVVIDAKGGAALYELTTGESQTDVYAYGGRIKVHKIDANTGFVANEDGALIGNDGVIGNITDYLTHTDTQIMGLDRVVTPMGYKFSADKKSILNSAGKVIDNGNNFCGIVNRTNSSFWVALNDDTPREDRAMDLMLELKAQGRLNYRTVQQIVAKDIEIDQYSLETYPHLSNLDPGTDTQRSTFHTISRYCTNLAFVVDGVAPGGNAKLATIWVNLGEPSVGAATPFFPAANSVSTYAYADTSFLGITMDLGPSSFINQTIHDMKADLYDASSINILAMLPPLEVSAELLLSLLQVNWLFSSGEENWSSFEGELSEWHVLWMANMAANDEADKTVDMPLLLGIQNWAIPLENIIFDKTEAYLSALRQDSTKITESNLLKYSNYCAEFFYLNYDNQSYSYKAWAFVNPWTTTTSSTSLFKKIFWWL
jgi:hypothetical protein